MEWVSPKAVRLVGYATETPQEQSGLQPDAAADAQSDEEADEEGLRGDDRHKVKRRRWKVDIGMLESGVYVPDKHQTWMAIILAMRLSRAAQTLNQLLAPQLLKLIDDESLKE